MDQELFRTNDMGCAAFLSLSGHSVQKVDFDEKGTCWWWFVPVPALMEQIDMWTADTALVNPRDYTKHFGQIKRMFHRAKDALSSGRAQ